MFSKCYVNQRKVYLLRSFFNCGFDMLLSFDSSWTVFLGLFWFNVTCMEN